MYFCGNGKVQSNLSRGYKDTETVIDSHSKIEELKDIMLIKCNAYLLLEGIIPTEISNLIYLHIKYIFHTLQGSFFK